MTNAIKFFADILLAVIMLYIFSAEKRRVLRGLAGAGCIVAGILAGIRLAAWL